MRDSSIIREVSDTLVQRTGRQPRAPAGREPAVVAQASSQSRAAAVRVGVVERREKSCRRAPLRPASRHWRWAAPARPRPANQTPRAGRRALTVVGEALAHRGPRARESQWRGCSTVEERGRGTPLGGAASAEGRRGPPRSCDVPMVGALGCVEGATSPPTPLPRRFPRRLSAGRGAEGKRKTRTRGGERPQRRRTDRAELKQEEVAWRKATRGVAGERGRRGPAAATKGEI